jgi:hypothetical protein
MLIAALVAAVGIPMLTAGPAQATSYRYWSYWHGTSGSWQFAGTGPSGYGVKDGSVEGWRFAVSNGTGAAPRPRYSADSAFNNVCGKVTQPADSIRVALIMDFGTAADAHPGDSLPGNSLYGKCVVLPASGARGTSVLNAYGMAVTMDPSGLICAFNGYPSVGCGEVVADPTPTPTRTPTPTHTATPTPTKQPVTGAGGGAATVPAPAVTSSPTPALSLGATASPSSGSGGVVSAGSATPTTSSPAVTSTAPAANGSSAAGAIPTDSGDPTLVVGAPISAQTAGGGTSPLPAGGGIALVAAIGGGAWWTRRRQAKT